MQALGLNINYEKSCLTPATNVVYLGFNIHYATSERPPTLSVPKPKVTKLKQDITRALKRPRISARLLARIAGRCISKLAVVFPCKLKLRNVYRLLNSETGLGGLSRLVAGGDRRPQLVGSLAGPVERPTAVACGIVRLAVTNGRLGVRLGSGAERSRETHCLRLLVSHGEQGIVQLP